MRRRPTRALLASAAALLTLALASCAHEATPLTDRPPPAQSVTRAIRALVDKQNVDFTAQLTLGGTTVTDRGSFVLHPATSMFTHSSDDGQGNVRTVDVLGVDDHYYVRAPEVTASAAAGCYVDARPRDLEVLTGGVYDKHLTFLPGAAVVAATARGSSYVDDHSPDVSGSVNLVDVLRLAGAGLPRQLGVRVARVPAELHIEDGVLVGISVALHDFVAANAIDRAKLADLGEARLDISFTFPSSPASIQTPASDDVSQYLRGAVTPCASAAAAGDPSEVPSGIPTGSPGDTSGATSGATSGDTDTPSSTQEP